MRRMVITLVAIAALSLTASGKGDGSALRLHHNGKDCEVLLYKAGLGDDIAWHTFRHSYRSWLDETGAPIGVQQKLMRHSDIRTTMNIYGDAIPETMREVHGKVVRMALRA